MLFSETLPLPVPELARRTLAETTDDDCLGLAAQLSFYLALALAPAILFVLALGSYFPLHDLSADLVPLLQPVASREILAIVKEQIMLLSDTREGGLLTFGVVGALWSSSAAVVAITSALNTAYDVTEGRPWWKVRLVALGLTATLAVLFLISFTLVLAGPAIAEYLGAAFHLGPLFVWSWKILQWPIVFALVSGAIALIYYVAPDRDQDWAWMTPGAVLATVLWFGASLAFKFYVSNFGDYDATYGTVGGVMVLLLWFYVSSLAVLIGAELNAEIEHASAHGKAPGEQSVSQEEPRKRGSLRSAEAPTEVPSPSFAGRALAAALVALGWVKLRRRS